MWSVYSFRLVGDGNETSITRDVDVCLGGVECIVCEGRRRGCRAGVFFFFFCPLAVRSRRHDCLAVTIVSSQLRICGVVWAWSFCIGVLIRYRLLRGRVDEPSCSCSSHISRSSSRSFFCVHDPGLCSAALRCSHIEKHISQSWTMRPVVHDVPLDFSMDNFRRWWPWNLVIDCAMFPRSRAGAGM